MKKIILFLALVAVAFGVWQYFSNKPVELDYSTASSIETPAEVDAALGSADVVDLDKELGSLDAEMVNL